MAVQMPTREQLLNTDLLIKEFAVFKSAHPEMYYAPFDFVNTGARVAIVGITPGWTQMEIGFRHASAVLRFGGAASVALRRAKEEASFAGPMRKTLVSMLDEIGVHTATGLKSCDDLFGSVRVVRIIVVHVVRSDELVPDVNGRRNRLLAQDVQGEGNQSFPVPLRK